MLVLKVTNPCLQPHGPGQGTGPHGSSAEQVQLVQETQQHMAVETWSAWDDVEEEVSQPAQGMTAPTTGLASTFRLGYANTYDPAADPWHEEGQLGTDELQHNPMAPYLPPPHRPHHQPVLQPGMLQPPTMDPWQSSRQTNGRTITRLGYNRRQLLPHRCPQTSWRTSSNSTKAKLKNRSLDSIQHVKLTSRKGRTPLRES